MNELSQKFATRMKMYKVNCSAVYQCAMFRGILRNKGYTDVEIIKGYCIVELMGKSSGACRHYWVRVNGEDIDVLKHVSAKYTPEILMFSTRLVSDIQDDMVRVDANDTDVVLQNESEYELFTNNIKDFWKHAPKCVRMAKIKV
jgi:hypothetical protein